MTSAKEQDYVMIDGRRVNDGTIYSRTKDGKNTAVFSVKEYKKSQRDKYKEFIDKMAN